MSLDTVIINVAVVRPGRDGVEDLDIEIKDGVIAHGLSVKSCA